MSEEQHIKYYNTAKFKLMITLTRCKATITLVMKQTLPSAETFTHLVLQIHCELLQ